MNNYQSLPKSPSQITQATVLQRFVDSIGFRYKLAMDGLEDDILDFCPVEGSMDMKELLTHIYRLLQWVSRSFDENIKGKKELKGIEDIRESTLAICAELSKCIGAMSKEDLSEVSVYLRRNETHYPLMYIINGPISDALTHIGQINSWRRIAGNPVPRVSPFTGEPY